jgi:hypothetical protein
MRKAISYMRFSSKRQEKGSSIDRQREALDGYLALNPDVELIDTLKDEAISGWTGKHATVGAFGRFVALLERGKFPVPLLLLVESIDRFSRENAIDSFDRLSDLTRRGVTLIFLDMQGEEVSRESLKDKPHILYLVWARMMTAHDFSARRSQLVRGAWNRNIRLAETTGCAIKGYEGPPWCGIDPATNRYTVSCPQTVETIRQIFSWRLEGVSDHGIAKLLNERQTPVLRAHVGPEHERRGWYQSSIHRTLSDRRVIGEGQYRGGPVIEGYFPQIIDPDTFARAQAAKAPTPRRLGNDDGASAVANLFTGIATCSACGGPMNMGRNRSGPTAIRYLQCGSRKRHFECTGKGMINYPVLEKAVLDNLPGVPWSEIVLAENPHDPLPALDTDIAHLEADIAKLEQERDNARRLMLEGEELEAEFRPILLARRRSVESAQTRLNKLQSDRVRLAANADRRPALVRNAIEYRDTMNLVGPAERIVIREKLADTLRAMIDKMTCDSDGKVVRIRLSPQFTIVVNMPIRRRALISLEYVDDGKLRIPFNNGHPEGVPRLLVPTKLYAEAIAPSRAKAARTKEDGASLA